MIIRRQLSISIWWKKSIPKSNLWLKIRIRSEILAPEGGEINKTNEALTETKKWNDKLSAHNTLIHDDTLHHIVWWRNISSLNTGLCIEFPEGFHIENQLEIEISYWKSVGNRKSPKSSKMVRVMFRVSKKNCKNTGWESIYELLFGEKNNVVADFQISDFFQNFRKFAPPALLAVWTRYRGTLKE